MTPPPRAISATFTECPQRSGLAGGQRSHLENGEGRRPDRDGTPPCDLNWMWRELGCWKSGADLLLEIRVCEIPVDQLPPRLDVLGARVAIVNVVRMLPNIAGEYRRLILA